MRAAGADNGADGADHDLRLPAEPPLDEVIAAHRDKAAPAGTPLVAGVVYTGERGTVARSGPVYAHTRIVADSCGCT